jgi:hypothetical protein
MNFDMKVINFEFLITNCNFVFFVYILFNIFIITFSILNREVSDRLPSDFKKIFTAWNSCQVMIEMLYKKCIAPIGQQL